MFEPSVPLGFLLSPFKNRLSQYLFYDTYIVSHKSYLNRARFLRIWHELGNGLEYSLHHTSILDNDRAQTSLIAVRVISTGVPRDIARLLIESSSNYVSFQDYVTLYKLSQRPVIAALPSMPLADLS